MRCLVTGGAGFIGRWLVGRRDSVVLATKCVGRMGRQPWQQGASRRHILDADFGARLADQLLTDVAQSKEISLEAWRRRPVTEKLLEGFFRLFSPLF